MKTIARVIATLSFVPVCLSLPIVDAAGPSTASRPLSIEERVAAQRAIERVYWTHRIWPAENGTPKPALDQVMPDTEIRAKVEDALRASSALERLWGRPITADQLQAEINRMTHETRDGAMLRELYAALNDDPVLIAECLARPVLAGRLLRNWHTEDDPSAWWERARSSFVAEDGTAVGEYSLTAPDTTGCTDDTWTQTKNDSPEPAAHHVTVWTGSEMFVLGNSGWGARYNPATDTWFEVSRVNGPGPRSYAAAVWTGTEVIVWGGYRYAKTAGNILNTGARYNPASDTWTPTSVGVNVPVPRSAHSAVWTGTQMIVWGGTTAANTTDSGGRYTPATDSWLPTSQGPGVPTPREVHTAVWTGTEMIVWGGNNANTPQSSGSRYNPVSDTWQPTNFMNVPTPRAFHGAVWTGSVMVVWGGQNDTGGGVFTGARYDPATDTWVSTNTAGAPPGRYGFGYVWTGSEMIVWGGNGTTTTPTGGRYDPVADSWLPTAVVGAPQNRAFPSAVWTGSELIVWGGSEPLAGCTGARYSPATNTWVPLNTSGTTPAYRAGHVSVWTGAEAIVWGGTQQSLFDPGELSSGGRFDPATNSWTPTAIAGAPTLRTNETAVWTGTEMIVWGGKDMNGNLNSGARYNPLANSWKPVSATGAPTGRNGHTAVWSGTQMIVWGGGGGSNTGGRYDPVSDVWTATGLTNVPLARTGHTAVWTGTEMIVWGGNVAGPSGGRYNPSTNIWNTTNFLSPNVPSARSHHTAVWTGSRMIIWGGEANFGGGPFVNTGGQYDPVADNWFPVSTGAGVPSARTRHAAVWTGTNMIVWGGTISASGTSFGDTFLDTGGLYNPATDSWTPTSTTAAPSGRGYGTVLRTNTDMIVWGGQVTRSVNVSVVNMTSTGGLYCSLPCTATAWYQDADGDHYGNPSVTTSSCTQPAGYVATSGDCNDADPARNSGAAELCNGIDDNCNGQADESADTDTDSVSDVCDNCPTEFNPTQSDTNHDGEGDSCDLNDGLIYIFGPDDKTRIEWQAEAGPSSWNVYEGDLSVLKSSGVYTQATGSNPLAGRQCGVADVFVQNVVAPGPGQVGFSLVTGVTGGIEGSLGTNSAGVPRANTNPCP